MEYLVPDGLSPIQVHICSLKTNHTYREILNQVKELQFVSNLVTCLMRSAKGMRWEPNQQGGNDTYLCDFDEKNLVETIIRCEEGFQPLGVIEVVDEAYQIKKSRLEDGKRFLIAVNCKELASKFQTEDIEPPSRSWVSQFSKKYDLKVSKIRNIDEKRILNCTKEKIQKFYEENRNIITQTPQELIFGADECMIDGHKSLKVLTKHETKEGLNKLAESFPHITAMFAHSASGVSLPPYIILANMKRASHEIQDILRGKSSWIVSTKSGWQTKQSFFVWCIFFTHWLTMYRISLPVTLMNNPALLIVDGHTSRQCPIAIELLKIHNVNLLVLPSHTSHITQMFDVILASAFKVTYKEKLMRVSKRDFTESLSTVGFHRYNSIVSLISAWYYISDIQNCVRSAKITGFFPFDIDIVVSSRFISEKNFEIPNHRRFLNINGRILTDDAVYQEILNNNEDKEDILYSSLSDPFESYKAKIIRITEKIKEDVSIFSTYPAVIIINNNFPLLITF